MDDSTQNNKPGSSRRAPAKKPTKRKATATPGARAQGTRSTARSSSYSRSSSRPSSGNRSGGSSYAARAARTSRSSAQRSRRTSSHAAKMTFKERLLTSRPALAAIAIVAVIALVGVFDMAANSGKAFGNVSVNGMNVSGMTSEQIQEMLREEFTPRVSHAQVTIYASDEVNDTKSDVLAEEARAIAEQISVEEANQKKSSWQVDSLSLKASLPIEQAAEQALAVGRSDGGIATRLGLLVGEHNVEMGVDFDEAALEELATDIDNTIGDPRIDATVTVEDIVVGLTSHVHCGIAQIHLDVRGVEPGL